MKLKKGYINLGEIKNPQAVYKDGIVTVWHFDGSGISQKKVNAGAGTVSDSAGTDKFFDRFVETPNKSIAVKGDQVLCW